MQIIENYLSLLQQNTYVFTLNLVGLMIVH